ncbi:YdcF family protein [Maridesulfovibrio hydrothermalis]|uniref:DUF218 domain-containing protein n=1 Tax=Maridesulfovibrio hydrothermalis AM13 = DSM 14728 TaxID=1121451 RepID=L0RDR3_9BACT|nr:YdcF family protein [Maridesulfovibrio hydrothermalis]CCO24894.1 conserved exported protein of unknown function [Maridesulfovibrio hydrothermalis AM13 = DSM 14728]
MKLIKPLLTLIGALTVTVTAVAVILFLFAPALLQEEDTLEKADAIVVLGGQYFRPIYAAELYNEGYAPKVLASRPVVMPEEKIIRALGINSPYQWEIYRDILLRKGVPKKDTSFFGKANVSTIDEAEVLKKTLDPKIKSIILVTSPLHTRRAGIIFRETLPAEIKVIVVSTPYEKVPKEWWKNFRTAPFIVLEVMKTFYYELGGGFRSSEQLTN